jgi:hypothetical protein
VTVLFTFGRPIVSQVLDGRRKGLLKTPLPADVSQVLQYLAHMVLHRRCPTEDLSSIVDDSELSEDEIKAAWQALAFAAVVQPKLPPNASFDQVHEQALALARVQPDWREAASDLFCMLIIRNAQKWKWAAPDFHNLRHEVRDKLATDADVSTVVASHFVQWLYKQFPLTKNMLLAKV